MAMDERPNPPSVTIGDGHLMALVYAAALETLASVERLAEERMERGEPAADAYRSVIKGAKGKLSWLHKKAGKAETNSQPFIFIQCGCGNGNVSTSGEGEHSCPCCERMITVTNAEAGS